MPMYEFRCTEGHSADVFAHHHNDKSSQTQICSVCGNSMGPVIAFAKPLLYFEEGRGRWVNNLGPSPIYVTSHAQLHREMKKAGVSFAGNRRGTPGSWI